MRFSFPSTPSFSSESMAIARELGLSRSEVSEAIPKQCSYSSLTNSSGPLAELDQVFQTFFEALTSAMVSILGPGHSSSSEAYKQDLLIPLRSENKAIPMQGKYWRKKDDPNQLSRSDLVSLKFAQLKASSSPSRPLCFKCGDPGHIANQCCNETLCFVCNRFGHSSIECGSMTAHIPVSPQLAQMQYHQAESWTNQQIPASYKISVTESIKRLETELTTIKHELVLLKKRRDAMEIDITGINTQFHRIQTHLAEIEQGPKPYFQPSKKGYDNDNGIGKGNSKICTDDVMTIGIDPSDDKFVIGLENQQSDVHPIDPPTKNIETYTSKIPAGKGTSKDCRIGSQVIATQNLKPTPLQTSVLSTPSQTQANSCIVPAKRVDGDVSKENLVSVTPVDQGSWISQVARTKFKKIESGSRELNPVTCCRENRSVHFKRVSTKGPEREMNERLMPMKIELTLVPKN